MFTSHLPFPAILYQSFKQDYNTCKCTKYKNPTLYIWGIFVSFSCNEILMGPHGVFMCPNLFCFYKHVYYIYQNAVQDLRLRSVLYICKDRMGWCYVWSWWRVHWVLHSPDKLQRWKPSTALHSGPLRLRWRNSCFYLIWISSCAVADDLEVKALKMKMMKASFPQH